jgi:tRNA dimethylallyltransferase
VVAIVGPTATGKSTLGLALAHRLNGEVVNADSMQVYRGMDIGTAKLRPEERQGIPHHVLDIWEVIEPASVVSYQMLAREAVDSVRSRGRVPLLVGGSGLYVRAVLEQFDFPGTDPALRASLEAELAAVGSAALHARLGMLAPEAAANILPTNGRRIVRALEVVTLTGTFIASLPAPTPYYPAVHIGLDRTDLDDRVAARVDAMFAAGLVEEVQSLEACGLRDGRTASRALGYQQVLAHLAGACSLAEARDETVQATRRFVRGQRTWFRRDPAVVWLDGASPTVVDDALALISNVE